MYRVCAFIFLRMLVSFEFRLRWQMEERLARFHSNMRGYVRGRLRGADEKSRADRI